MMTMTMLMTARFKGKTMQGCWVVTNGLESSGKKAGFEHMIRLLFKRTGPRGLGVGLARTSKEVLANVAFPVT